MLKKIAAILMLAATTLLTAQPVPVVTPADTAKIRPSGYDFTAPTMKDSSQGDPGRSKLCDDSIGGGNRILWSLRENNRKPLVLTFTFPEAHHLRRSRIYYYRGPRSYGIKRIDVYAGAVDERLPLGSLVLDQPYQLPEGETPDGEISIALDETVPVTQLTLEIRGTGGYLGLSEIEFYGRPQRPAAAADSAAGANPWMRLAQREARGLQLTRHGEALVIENDHVLYVIDPENNGCINLAYDKKNDFNYLKYNSKDDFGGMFNDRFWGARDAFRGVSYQAEITSDTEQQKAVRLTATGKGGIFDNVTITKTYTLRPDSLVLSADYAIHNDQANVIPLQNGLWIMGGIAGSPPGELAYPGLYRVEKRQMQSQSHFCPGAIRGWCSAVSPAGTGLALLCDYELFKSFYFWSNSAKYSTMECRLGVYDIPANDTLKTSFALTPLYGLGTPDQINRRAAGSLSLPAETAAGKLAGTARVLPLQAGNYELEIWAGQVRKDTPEIDFTLLTKTAADNSLGTLIELPYAKPDATSGTWVIKGRLTVAGEEIMVMLGSTVVGGKSSGTFALPAECERRPESGDGSKPLNLNFNSLSVSTPHVPWAHPYAGKKPKVLALCQERGGIRDMIEVAQRFDIDLTTNFISGIWSLSGFCTALSETDCYNELAKKLQDRFDVIAVSSRLWQTMPLAIRDSILGQVRAGTGLVLIAPEGHPAELAEQFSLADNPQHFTAAWAPTGEHYLTDGIPFAFLPPARGLPYTTTGTVLATVGTSPLLSVFTLGEGRVVAAGWAVDGRLRNDYHLQYAFPVFLPLMIFDPPAETWHYWEYHLSLLARMLYWSAKAEHEIRGQRLQVESGQLRLEVSSPAAVDLRLELTLRDRYYRSSTPIVHPLSLPAGLTPVSLDFPIPTFQGTHLADVRILNDAGVVWWGSAAFEVTAPAAIQAIHLEEKIWRPAETISGRVESSGAGQLTVSLFDNQGNELARTDRADFNFPLHRCRTLTAKIIAVQQGAAGENDRLERELRLFGPPNPRRLQITWGWPTLSQKGVHQFLLPVYYDLFASFSMTASTFFRTDTPLEFLETRRHNFVLMGDSSPASTGGKFPFDRKAVINSKFDIIRTPCLSEPGFKDKLENDSRCVTELEQYGTLFRNGPDESNSVGKWEGCFSPACQAEFRLWLKRRYGTLEALNQSWESDWKQWDEVVAMTSDEAKLHTSYAPWLDHRAFNDWNLSDALAHLVKGMKEANPEQRYCLSGTQEPSPFNAWEWHGIMHSLEAIQAYVGEQTIMQRSFRPEGFFRSCWIGYDRPYDSENQRILDNLFVGGSGLSIYGRFYINPDFTLPERGRELQKLLARFSNGPAEAIFSATAVTWPLAVLYSPASIKTAWISDQDDLRRDGTAGLRICWDDLALSYDYVASAQLNEKEALNKYKILMLPMNSALAPAETEAIRAFVANGGTLIADMQAGLFTEHGKKTTPQLADVFGLQPQRPQVVRAVADLRAVDETGASLSLAGLKMQVKAFESDVVPTTAHPLAQLSCEGKTYPALLLNTYGRGRALYLACALPQAVNSWGGMRYARNNLENLQKIEALLDTLCRDAGIHPEVSAPTLPATTIAIRRNGPASIVGLIRQTEQTVSMDPKTRTHTVSFATASHVYELFEGTYLGFGKQLELEFGPVTQRVLVLLPYRPEGVTVSLSRQGDGYAVRLHLQGAPAQGGANHIFRVSLSDPQGQVNPALSDLIYAEGPTGTWEFALPLNAAPGEWTLHVKEILTGLQTNCPVK